MVPAGRFLTAPLVIAADNVYLVFDGPDAVLVASTDFGLWPTVAALPSYPVDSDHTCGALCKRSGRGGRGEDN